jgi:hypothetical protein
MCKLESSDRFQNPRNLLALKRPGPRPAWDMRGRFLPGEVTGRCGNDPAWGRDRLFAVQGMLVRLRVFGVERDAAGSIMRYNFSASVRNIGKATIVPTLGVPPTWFGGSASCPT